MDDIIKLKSRCQNNYLKKMQPKEGGESYTYLLKVESYTVRAGYTEDNRYFIDPSGGPMIIVGELLEVAGAVVKSIDHIPDYGIAITFEPPQ